MAQPLEHIDGKYEILEKLKEGGMGAIYKVRHRLLEEIRVIKVMRPMLRDDEELYARFLREAKMAIQLRHPNIAQLYDFTIDGDGNAFIVMEYIRGLNLGDLIDQAGPPPLALTLEMAIQSLRALDYLHRQGFVHRDISPDNLMLSRDFDDRPLIKLIDLGIAKALEGNSDLTATGHFLGKVRYCSPEQLESTSSITPRSDLYSFGLVLYELLTGQCPISGDSPSALIAGHLVHPPAQFERTDPRGRVPVAVRQVTLKALAKKAEDRHESAEAFLEALLEIQRDHPCDDATVRHARTLLDSDLFTVSGRIQAGSTQRRLDQEFGLHSTPQPEARTDRLPGRGDGPLPLPEPPLSAGPPAPPTATTLLGPPRGERVAARSSSRKGLWWGLALLVVLSAAGAFAWWAWQRYTQTEQAAVVSESGTLIVNATPWAQVTAIVDADGTPHALAAETYTPAVLHLPTGDYTLTLRYGEATQDLRAEVRTGTVTRLQANLQEISTDEWLQQLGW